LRDQKNGPWPGETQKRKAIKAKLAKTQENEYDEDEEEETQEQSKGRRRRREARRGEGIHRQAGRTLTQKRTERTRQKKSRESD
jgi:hypothetical protein